MGPNEGLITGIDRRLDVLNRRAEFLLRCLNYSPGRGRRAKRYGGPMRSEDIRAHAAVSIVAELESFTRGLITDTHRGLNAARVRTCDLQPCIRSLVAHSQFQRIRDSANHVALWQARSEVTRMGESTQVATFPTPTKGPIPPLDGRTLVPEHFRRIWAVYGLSGEAIPSARTAGYLQKLALMRNDIAHANQEVDEIFREPGREASDVAEYVEHVRMHAQYVLDHWSEWLSDERYLARP